MVFLPPSAAYNNLTATTHERADSGRTSSTSSGTGQGNTDWAVDGEDVHAQREAVVGTSGEIDGHENRWGEKQRGLSTDSKEIFKAAAVHWRCSLVEGHSPGRCETPGFNP